MISAASESDNPPATVTFPRRACGVKQQKDRQNDEKTELLMMTKITCAPSTLYTAVRGVKSVLNERLELIKSYGIRGTKVRQGTSSKLYDNSILYCAAVRRLLADSKMWQGVLLGTISIPE